MEQANRDLQAVFGKHPAGTHLFINNKFFPLEKFRRYMNSEGKIECPPMYHQRKKECEHNMIAAGKSIDVSNGDKAWKKFYMWSAHLELLEMQAKMSTVSRKKDLYWR
jgi:hypothetical protein